MLAHPLIGDLGAATVHDAARVALADLTKGLHTTGIHTSHWR